MHRWRRPNGLSAWQTTHGFAFDLPEELSRRSLAHGRKTAGERLSAALTSSPTIVPDSVGLNSSSPFSSLAAVPALLKLHTCPVSQHVAELRDMMAFKIRSSSLVRKRKWYLAASSAEM